MRSYLRRGNGRPAEAGQKEKTGAVVQIRTQAAEKDLPGRDGQALPPGTHRGSLDYHRAGVGLYGGYPVLHPAGLVDLTGLVVADQFGHTMQKVRRRCLRASICPGSEV